MFIAASSLFFMSLLPMTPAFAGEKDESVERLPTGAQVFKNTDGTKKVESWIPENTRNPAMDGTQEAQKKSGWKFDSEDVALHPDTDDDLVIR